MTDRVSRRFDLLQSQMERSPGFFIWVSFLLALIFLGAYALLMSVVHSMEILEFYTNIPWEMMVSNYIFLVGSSVGLCLIASMGYVFGLRRYELIGKRCIFLSLITIIFGLSSIGLHLGHPERGAVYNALTPNLRSAMWWMGVLYPPYILFIAIWFWVLTRQELIKTAETSSGLTAKVYRLMALEGIKAYLYGRLPLQKIGSLDYRLLPLRKIGSEMEVRDAELRWASILGGMAVVLALMAYTVEGSLFAHIETRPFWYGTLYPIDFFLGALMCGFSWIMATSIITYKVKGEEIPVRLMDL
ncbi:MAG: polysulfide reductase NrfD [Deltaproteobacteria bacterium]|nr:polysulfide reductase NrfD [Deltaproteobacteria bacterium]MBW2152414.1 polysulfide reductase NrfD [Deltaproteobacteria bacterium]